jgi:DNA-binding GntR family transcriptional regulator
MDDEPDAPLRKLERPSSLRHQAYDRIRRDLLPGGSLSTKQRLVERELADHLSMSRTPVRDALRRLALAGIVEPLAGGGYVRRRVTLRDVEELHELLLLLEPIAVRMAAEAKREVVDRLLASEAVVKRDLSPTADSRFHVAIAEASGNLILARVVATLNERLAAGHRLFGPSEPTASASLADGHEAIIDAIQHRDAPSAEEAMRRHIEFGRDLLSSRLRMDPAYE